MADQSRLIYAGGFAPYGGVESFTCTLASALSAAGRRCEIACWGNNSSMLRNLSRVAPVRRIAWRWGCRFGIPDRVLVRVIRRQIAEAKVIVFPKLLDPPTHESVLRAGGRSKCMLVTQYRPREMLPEMARRYGNARVRGVLNAMSAITVQAQEFAADLREFGVVAPVVTLPLLSASPASPPTPFPPTDILRVGYIGRLVAQKNLPYLARAIAHLMRTWRRSAIEWHVFGDGPTRRDIETVLRRESAANSAVFHGRISPDATAAAIDSCHMFAFSSVSEGQCLGALEALSRGRPVVATPVGALPDILKNGALGCIGAESDPAVFAQALAWVLSRVSDGTMEPDGVVQAYSDRFAPAVLAQQYMAVLDALGDA